MDFFHEVERNIYAGDVSFLKVLGSTASPPPLLAYIHPYIVFGC